MTTPVWAVIATVPPLPGAACKGLPAHWWDIRPHPSGNRNPRDLTLFNLRALETCRTCPARTACDTQPGIQRQDVILAGNAYGTPKRTGEPVIITTSERAAA